MSYQYDESYAQDTFANAGADFDYASTNASSGDQVVNEPTANGNAPDWQWTDESSPSSSTGPPAANGGCTYPETSSPAANGDVCHATMKTANQVNASTYGIYVTVDVCMYGNTSGEVKIQAWNGTGWVDLATYAGNATTTFVSRGPFNCTTYTNSDFYVRIQVTLGGTAYQNDFAFQNLRLYGNSKVSYEVTGVTRDKDGSALGSCDVYLVKDGGDDTFSFIDHVTSNATTGAFTFSSVADNDPNYQIISFKDGTTDVMDCTEITITPTEA